MREEIRMRNALELIRSYDHTQPLNAHLKKYFRDHRNTGSRDRKILSALVYGFYRYKRAFRFSEEEKILAHASAEHPLLTEFYNYWKQKIDLEDDVLNFETYFPLGEKISAMIDKPSFIRSHLQQPYVWIRCRKNQRQAVARDMENNGFEFEVHGESLSFRQPGKLEETDSFKKGLFEIQDISSQHCSELFNPSRNEAWWDCCAGSGGKSLLLLEKEPQLQLFVSDNREPVIRNLKERFYRNNIQNFNSFIADLTNESELNRLPQFDWIIADVPCSGSGTWGRRPEWLSFFTDEHLNRYIQLQQTIVRNITPQLKPGGGLIYITCSVFADENENNVKFFCSESGYELLNEKYFQFSAQGGDTMYGAALRRDKF